MTSPFFAHGHASRRWIRVGSGSSATSSESGRADRREQLEQLGEARDGVVGRQEVREDVAAADRSREDDTRLRRRLRQVAERVRRADDLERVARELVDLARDRVREGGLAVDPALGEQAHVQQQRLVDRDLVALLVDR